MALHVVGEKGNASVVKGGQVIVFQVDRALVVFVFAPIRSNVLNV